MAEPKNLEIKIIPKVTLPGWLLIMAERDRQVDEEGWTPADDAAHTDGELLEAALAYLVHVANDGDPADEPPVDWPWDPSWWKPTDDPRRTLTKAGALIAAEIDRIQAASR